VRGWTLGVFIENANDVGYLSKKYARSRWFSGI
jgi:hypothetical protein